VINTNDRDDIINADIPREINKNINEQAKTPKWEMFVLKNKNILYSLNNDNISAFNNMLETAKSSSFSYKYNLENFIHNSNEEQLYMFFDGQNANPKYGESLILFVELNLLSRSIGINLNVNDEGLVLHCSHHIFLIYHSILELTPLMHNMCLKVKVESFIFIYHFMMKT
jgi:hypothetical protein